jgi:hypothetical protein
MTDPFCIGLLILWMTQADGLAPEPPAREPARRPAASVADGGAEPGSSDRRPRDRRSDATLLRALAASDPPVDALRAAASALALTEPDRARSLVLRARLAGWLPELRGGFYRRFARAESVDLGASVSTPLAPVGIDSDNDVRYELRATWDLAKLVFNPDEIGAHFQALRTADARREIESLVIRLYFDRRRLKAELGAADATATGMALSGLRAELRIAEIEAELDALTGGAFTRLSRRRAEGGTAADE